MLDINMVARLLSEAGARNADLLKKVIETTNLKPTCAGCASYKQHIDYCREQCAGGRCQLEAQERVLSCWMKCIVVHAALGQNTSAIIEKAFELLDKY